MQQSPVEQARAAAVAQNGSPGLALQEASLQPTDLINDDVAEDDAPPPAYGDVYGQIRNEKDGLGTNAHVTGDGRVNIRINQFNRRLSQIFTPALRQQVQDVQASHQPPAYIPPSFGGTEGNARPPRLNIVIQVVGSRGDVQPFLALGKILKDVYGHRVRLATHPIFKDFVQQNGLEFFSIGGDPSRLMAFMVKNPGLMPSFRSVASGDVGERRRDVGEYIQGCWRSCYEAGDGLGHATDSLSNNLCDSSEDNPDARSAARPFVADCIIANPPSFAHIHCAEKLGIPLHIMFTMPYSPTQAFPHPLANIQSSNADPQLTNWISYAMTELLSWQGLGDIINRFRRKCLGLDPVGLLSGPGMLERLKIPHTYCWSPALIPKPKDWGSHISVAGFYLLDSSDYTPAPNLQAFLESGPAPIYIGFGSIVVDDPAALTVLILKAAQKTRQRVLLSEGWGDIGSDYLPDSVFMLGNVPHDWLFKHVSCVVHHGGAGTTAAGITAGRPTVIVPFFGDQPFWGAMVARAGAGPDPIPIKQLTAEKLANAIEFCLRPESLERAAELASKIDADRGTDTGAQLFHQQLDADRLRCTLAPHRPAAWRIRRTKIRLSAFAACTLANANLLDFHDLRLFRPQEHYTDEGPVDPISGGFMTALGAFSDMGLGLAETPMETWKAVQIPFRSSRTQSEASVSTIASTNEAGSTNAISKLPTPPGQSQATLIKRKPLAHTQSSPNFSNVSSTSLEHSRSSSTSNGLQRQWSSQQADSSRSRVRSRVEYSSAKNRDVLRHTGAHGSQGIGRSVKALAQSPMDISVSLTKGLHNVPKLWGDDTVRPQEQVRGMKSGMQAMGREFGFGMYDGFTGLITQPWKGAQEGGISGFAKGVGKGIGGLVAKPSSAMLGILSHPMKGVHKEVQKLFGSNVQNYIIASRTAQGYEEWLQSSEAEKQDVIVRWKLIQKYLQKKRGVNDEIIQHVLDAQRNLNGEVTDNRQNSAGTPLNDSTDASTLETLDAESLMSDRNSAYSHISNTDTIHEISRRAGERDHGLAVQERSYGDAEQNGGNQRRAQHDRTTNSTVHYENDQKQAPTMHMEREARSSSDSEWSSSRLGLNDSEDEEFERARAESVSGASRNVQTPPSYDSGHLAGTTQFNFEAQRRGQRREKTAQEKTEEEIVMEYIKKQSLLEVHHSKQGKGRAAAVKDEEEDDDEDLRKALELSLLDHQARGEASKM